jgi:hypothetical protein
LNCLQYNDIFVLQPSQVLNMKTKNSSTVRILNAKEVKAMLLLDAEIEDKKIGLVRYDWTKSIKSVLWNPNCGIPHDKICVDVHVMGCDYVAYVEHRQENVTLTQITSEDIQANWWLKSSPSVSGLSIFDLEDLVDKMKEVGVIKALFDAGFTLTVIIPARLLR